jgi:hypothetical protein
MLSEPFEFYILNEKIKQDLCKRKINISFQLVGCVSFYFSKFQTSSNEKCKKLGNKSLVEVFEGKLTFVSQLRSLY